MAYHLISSLSKLEKLLDIHYDITNRAAFEKHIFTHPLRFTDYLIAQIKRFPSIAKQYLPDPRELDPVGIEKPFTGVIDTGVPGLERMYLDRVILMPTSQCFAYCRFCFRKNYSHDARTGDYATPQESFKKAFQYIRRDSRIKEVLITGGDPLIFPRKILEIVEKLRQIEHLTGIRIGSRIFTSDPELITEEWVKPWKVLNTFVIARSVATKQSRTFQYHTNPHGIASPRELGARNDGFPHCPISFSPHINHPDELSSETIRALLRCTKNNIPLYNQTVLLKGVNDDPEILIDLFRKLRQMGVEPYRVYHADPLSGSEHFRVSIERFMEIKRYLRAHASGRIVPSFVIDTRIGKIELGADSSIVVRSETRANSVSSNGTKDAVMEKSTIFPSKANNALLRAESEIVKKRGRTVWIKTPYTLEIFRSMQRAWKVPDFCTVAKDRRLIILYDDAVHEE